MSPRSSYAQTPIHLLENWLQRGKLMSPKDNLGNSVIFRISGFSLVVVKQICIAFSHHEIMRRHGGSFFWSDPYEPCIRPISLLLLLVLLPYGRGNRKSEGIPIETMQRHLKRSGPAATRLLPTICQISSFEATGLGSLNTFVQIGGTGAYLIPPIDLSSSGIIFEKTCRDRLDNWFLD